MFKPDELPWIVPEGATTQQIIAQIDQCPSGALSYRMNAGANEDALEISSTVCEVTTNGPLLVKGDVVVKHADGREEMREKLTAFCRCGASQNKPYCDGAHSRTGFKDPAE